MNRDVLAAVVKELGTATKDFVARKLKARDDRLEKLEQRVAELEARPTVKYAGVWVEHQLYKTGELVTCSGSVWHANVDNRSVRPGGASEKIWTLAVKRGADGKDGR